MTTVDCAKLAACLPQKCDNNKVVLYFHLIKNALCKPYRSSCAQELVDVSACDCPTTHSGKNPPRTKSCDRIILVKNFARRKYLDREVNTRI